jgi:hypothetical protein
MIAAPLPHVVDEGALTVAMAVAPGVYARNRMFAFHKDPAVRRARARAATIRGLVRQLQGAHGAPCELVLARGARCVLKYRIDRLRLERKVELTEIEAACFAYLAARAGVRDVHATAEDRAMVDAALRRLATGLDLGELER